MCEASITCNSSTLPIRWSRWLGALARAWEEGCAVSSGTKVKCLISSSMSPPSSATPSLGIWETPIVGLGIWALLRMMVYSLIRSSLCITWSTLGIFTLALKIKDMTRIGNGKVSLEFLFVMHVRTYVNHVRNNCHLELANPLTKCTLLVIG